MSDLDDNIFVINNVDDGSEMNAIEENHDATYYNSDATKLTDAIADDVEAATSQNVNNDVSANDDADEVTQEKNDSNIEGLIPLCVRHASGPKLSTAAFGYDIAEMNERPWLNPAANRRDYFNYGFNERSWRLYCAMQEHGSESLLEQANQMLEKLEAARYASNGKAGSSGDYRYYQTTKKDEANRHVNERFAVPPEQEELFQHHHNNHSLSPLPPLLLSSSQHPTFSYSHPTTPQPTAESSLPQPQNYNSSGMYNQFEATTLTTNISNNEKRNENAHEFAAIDNNNSDEATIVSNRENLLAASHERELASQPLPQYMGNYKTKLCQRFMDGHCARGSECNYAHGVAELRTFTPRPTFPINHFTHASSMQLPYSAATLPSPTPPIHNNITMTNYQMYDQRFVSYPAMPSASRFIAPPMPQPVIPSSLPQPPPPQQAAPQTNVSAVDQEEGNKEDDSSNNNNNTDNN